MRAFQRYVLKIDTRRRFSGKKNDNLPNNAATYSAFVCLKRI